MLFLRPVGCCFFFLSVKSTSFTLPNIHGARASSFLSTSKGEEAGEECLERPKLFDLPVSNNGARCRMVIYYKNIESLVDIESPMALGGLKSPGYLSLNPQGKMPLLVTEDHVAIPESDTIARYLLDRYADTGPSLQGSSLSERTLSNSIARHHDIYLGAIQACLYKATPPFGIFGNRQVL